MGRIRADYPDTAEAVMLLIEEQWYPVEFAPREAAGERGYRTGRVFPDNLPEIIAAGEMFVRVTDIGGNDDGITDRPLIDIDVFADTFERARDYAKGIQSRLLGYPWRAGSTVIDKVRTAMRPHDVPWDDDNTFRFYASYTISARR